MRCAFRNAIFLSALVLAFASGAVRAQEIPLVTGEHWTKASDEQKKAYLVGMANIVQVELAYAGASPPSDTQSVLPRMARGLKGQTLDSLRDGLNKWYAANPQR